MKQLQLKNRLLWAVAIIFVLLNLIAFFHAYKFTHFTTVDATKTKSPTKLSILGKIETLLFGINNPRPANGNRPTQKFDSLVLQSNKKIACWTIKAEPSKGTVILFHGYGGQKSDLIDKSDEFLKLGYSTMLVDFMGSGASEGNQTTIGYKEAENVRTAIEYLTRKGEKNIVLFGSSMGAVAILKAISDDKSDPAGIIIECPFGSMYQTTCARFRMMQVPTFPMAALLDFWGGIQNGFWAFGHEPTAYAKAVKCPTLLLYGEQDTHVTRGEIDEIYTSLTCKKELKTYPLAGHENYLIKYQQQWTADIQHFLQALEK